MYCQPAQHHGNRPTTSYDSYDILRPGVHRTKTLGPPPVDGGCFCAWLPQEMKANYKFEIIKRCWECLAVCLAPSNAKQKGQNFKPLHCSLKSEFLRIPSDSFGFNNDSFKSQGPLRTILGSTADTVSLGGRLIGFTFAAGDLDIVSTLIIDGMKHMKHSETKSSH